MNPNVKLIDRGVVRKEGYIPVPIKGQHESSVVKHKTVPKIEHRTENSIIKRKANDVHLYNTKKHSQLHKPAQKIMPVSTQEDA